MKTKRISRKRTTKTSDLIERAAIAPLSHVDAAGLSGSIAGAAIGAMAGPAGVLAGGLVGTVVGALVGRALDQEDASEETEDARLDAAIGVSGGPMGAAPPDAPKAKLGCYSAGSAGVSSPGSSAPSEGPMQDIDADA